MTHPLAIRPCPFPLRDAWEVTVLLNEAAEAADRRDQHARRKRPARSFADEVARVAALYPAQRVVIVVPQRRAG